MSLAEMLDNLAKRCNLSFDFDEQAFKDAKIKDVAKTYVSDIHPIPPLHTKIATVLKRVLAHVSASVTTSLREGRAPTWG